jgi:hypothetical protein
MNEKKPSFDPQPPLSAWGLAFKEQSVHYFDAFKYLVARDYKRMKRVLLEIKSGLDMLLKNLEEIDIE